MATIGEAAAASGEDKNSGGKIPVPVFDGTNKTIMKFRREVAVWQIGTEMKLPKQGATLLASLKGKAEEACEELDLETIKGDGSVEVFLEGLGKRFPEIEVLELPALLGTFVKPACIRHKFEEIRHFRNRFRGIATKLKAKDIEVPDEVLADLYIKGVRLPPEHAASVLNGVGNKFNPTKIQEQLMINSPKASAATEVTEKDHKKVCATEAYDEAENDGASTDSSEGYGDDLRDDLQDVIDEAEEQVASFTKKMVRAKDKLKEAKQARGYFAKRDGGRPPNKGDAKIAEMKARTQCGARGQKGHWRGGPQCPKKNEPNARADIPRKGSHTTNLTTNDGAGDAQEPHVAEMTVAAVYQHEQLRAARDRRKVTFGSALHDIDWTNMRQQANVPEEVAAASFYTNKDNQCLMAATGSAHIYISVEDLLEESGGELTFDTACSRCVGGLDWYNDIKKKLAAFNIQPIECPKKESLRSGASKLVHSRKSALIPCSVNGKAFTVRVSIVRSAVPGLFSRQAHSELDILYHAAGNKLDIKSVNEHGIQMGLGRAGHPTLEITGVAPRCKHVSDVSDTETEIRLHPFATYHAETAVASAAKLAAPERCDQGVVSEADESQSETDCDELDSAELFEQQLRQLLRRVPWQIQPPQLFTNRRPALMPPSQPKCMISPRATNREASYSNTPTPSTSRLPAISSMRMGGPQAGVASYELDVRDATCDQLRVIPRALRAQGQDKKAQDIPGLGKMHAHEPQEFRWAKDIDFDQHATVPELRQRLQGWKVEDAVSGASSNVAHPSLQITGNEKMRFGKYPTADYRWVLKNDLGNARWAVLELNNGWASPLLARFARWVKAHGVKPPEPEKAKTAIEAAMAEEVVLDDESATPAATTQRASASQGSSAGHRRPRPVEGHEMDTGGHGFQKAGETDQETDAASPQVTGLLSAFAFQAVLTADWPPRPLKPLAQYATSAARGVAGHMRNFKEVYAVQSHGVDAMQVFGGEGGITEAAVRRNMTATEVIHRKFGWDLRKQKDLEMTCERYYASRPKFASIELELSCAYYANIANFNFRAPPGKQALRRLRRAERPFLFLARDLFKSQLDPGGVAMIENPATSRIWTQRIMMELLADKRVYQVMCEYGARCYKTGGLIKHPAKLLVAHKEYERPRRTCSRKRHDQTLGDNMAVRKSGVYPAKSCRAVVRVVEQIIRRQGGPRAYQVDCGASSLPFIATELKEQATACANDTAPLGETGEPIGDPDPMGGGDDSADTRDVKAVKGLICGARRSQQRPSARRPAHFHFVQDFGDDVGSDCFELKDVDGKSYWYFSIVDLATTFHFATLIGRHASQEFATAFERCWASWAGVDMERGFGGVLSDLFQSFDTVQLPVAGQAHWHLGRVERQGAWWKELAARTIERSSIRGEGEMRTLGIMVSGAKNSLRRRARFSPPQRVLGRDPKMPADLVGDTANCSAHSLAANDEKIRRRYAIRTAARESFMRLQNDDQLRRAMLARARTVATPLSVGEMCYMLRQVKMKEQKEQHNRNAKRGIWRGPCVVIGHQGNNTWVSLGGRAMLAAPEHIKALAPDDVWFPNSRDEIGQAVAELNRARDSLEQEEALVEDIRPEPGQPEVRPDEMEQAWRKFIDSPDDDDLCLNVPEDPKPQEQIEVLPADRADIPQSALEEQPYGPAEFRRRRATFDGTDSGNLGPARKRLQTAKEHAGSGGPPPRAASRDRAAVPDGGAAAGSETEGAREAMQTSIATERTKGKQADEEIRWRAIKDSDRELYREAAAKQWSEWQKYGSFQVLTIEESEAVSGMVKANLILPSRFVHRAKARLCVGGYMDPRLAQGDLRTDAPTVTRNSTMLFFTICQRLDLEIYAADVEVAFMQGDEQPDQQLCMAQPREGLPGLHPKQLIKILKRHSHDKLGELCAVVVARVDDLLLGVSPKYPRLYDRLYKFLPWGDWRGGVLHLRQTEFADAIEEIALSKERKTELSAEATPAEFSDNRSALGALGWLSWQTRPDLSAGVAMRQHTQNKPTIQDLLETNRLIKLARKHADVGLEVPKLRGPFCLVTYHDASWANADEPPEGVVEIVGSKDKKVKIRSQAGYVTFVAEVKLACGPSAQRFVLIVVLPHMFGERCTVLEGMAFCLDHADMAVEIAECITQALTILETEMTLKMSRLLIVSDILHNTASSRPSAWAYRREFEKSLPDIMEHFNIAIARADSKLQAEKAKEQVMRILRVWEDWGLFAPSFIRGLEASVAVGVKRLRFLATRGDGSREPTWLLPKLTDWRKQHFSQLEKMCRTRGLRFSTSHVEASRELPLEDARREWLIDRLAAYELHWHEKEQARLAAGSGAGAGAARASAAAGRGADELDGEAMECDIDGFPL
ncbi:unnamed protein product, partial [Prorocentrum cordatum]